MTNLKDLLASNYEKDDNYRYATDGTIRFPSWLLDEDITKEERRLRAAYYLKKKVGTPSASMLSRMKNFDVEGIRGMDWGNTKLEAVALLNFLGLYDEDLLTEVCSTGIGSLSYSAPPFSDEKAEAVRPLRPFQVVGVSDKVLAEEEGNDYEFEPDLGDIVLNEASQELVDMLLTVDSYTNLVTGPRIQLSQLDYIWATKVAKTINVLSYGEIPKAGALKKVSNSSIIPEFSIYEDKDREGFKSASLSISAYKKPDGKYVMCLNDRNGEDWLTINAQEKKDLTLNYKGYGCLVPIFADVNGELDGTVESVDALLAGIKTKDYTNYACYGRNLGNLLASMSSTQEAIVVSEEDPKIYQQALVAALYIYKYMEINLESARRKFDFFGSVSNENDLYNTLENKTAGRQLKNRVSAMQAIYKNKGELFDYAKFIDNYEGRANKEVETFAFGAIIDSIVATKKFKFLGLVPEEFLTPIEHIDTKAKAKVRASAMKHNVQKLLSADLPSMSTELMEHKRKAANIELRIKAIQERIKAATDIGLTGLTGIERSLRELDRMKLVESYSFSMSVPDKINEFPIPEAFTFTTGDIIATDKEYLNDYFFLGKFRVTVNLVNYNVDINAIDPRMLRRATYGPFSPHPHVTGSIPCLGNIGTMISDYAEQAEFGALAMILIRYLQSANIEDSAGVGLANWPKCDKEGNLLEGELLYPTDNSEGYTRLERIGREVTRFERKSIHNGGRRVQIVFMVHNQLTGPTTIYLAEDGKYYGFDRDLTDEKPILCKVHRANKHLRILPRNKKLVAEWSGNKTNLDKFLLNYYGGDNAYIPESLVDEMVRYKDYNRGTCAHCGEEFIMHHSVEEKETCPICEALKQDEKEAWETHLNLYPPETTEEATAEEATAEEETVEEVTA
jgi:hypothetical protein